jgi:LysR family transcriptional regulator, glycine cleavage system transcriptional activator
VLDRDHHKVRSNLPPLNGLRLFEAAARCGSFKRAAQELDLTPAAISHGIKSLEEWLGVELFDRSRELVLTTAGHRYLPYIKEALSMIVKGTSETLASDPDADDTAGAIVELKIGLR